MEIILLSIGKLSDEVYHKLWQFIASISLALEVIWVWITERIQESFFALLEKQSDDQDLPKWTSMEMKSCETSEQLNTNSGNKMTKEDVAKWKKLHLVDIA